MVAWTMDGLVAGSKALFVPMDWKKSPKFLATIDQSIEPADWLFPSYSNSKNGDANFSPYYALLVLISDSTHKFRREPFLG